MSSRPDLKLDWCTHEAAKYAVTHWHYSQSLPGADSVKIGAWENGMYVGCVMFGRGATPELCKPYGLAPHEVCELTRVALTVHLTPTSRMIAIAIKMLRAKCPRLRLIVSFADTEQGHHGGIYQAGGWLFVGSVQTHAYIVNGSCHHPKSLHSRYGKGGQSIPWLREHVDPAACRVMCKPKHRYLMPLDADMRARILPLSKPYPKRAVSIASDAPASQAGEGGSTPTTALHPSFARKEPRP